MMYRALKHSRLRSVGSFGLALPLLIVLLSVVGYVVTSAFTNFLAASPETQVL